MLLKQIKSIGIINYLIPANIIKFNIGLFIHTKLYSNLLEMNAYYFYFSHVQVNNDGAINFYKKFGFEIVETKEHYYKRIEPADAHVLQKTIRSKTENQIKQNGPQLNGIEKKK